MYDNNNDYNENSNKNNIIKINDKNNSKYNNINNNIIKEMMITMHKNLGFSEEVPEIKVRI